MNFRVLSSSETRFASLKKRAKRETVAAWAGEALYVSMLLMFDDVLDKVNEQACSPDSLSMKFRIEPAVADYRPTQNLEHMPHYHRQIADKLRRILATEGNGEAVNHGS